MVRSELISELRIRRNEIYAELKECSSSLVAQLMAIDSMMDVDMGNPITATVGVNNKPKGTAKGESTWVDYVYLMLQEIGGSGKTNDVANAIFNANKNITFKRAKNACADKLSKLARAGKIKATKGNSPKDGNWYEII